MSATKLRRARENASTFYNMTTAAVTDAHARARQNYHKLRCFSFIGCRVQVVRALHRAAVLAGER